MTITSSANRRPIFSTSEIAQWPEAMKEDFVRQFVDLRTRELVEDPVESMVWSMLSMFQDVWEEYDLTDGIGGFLRAFGDYCNDVAWDCAMVADDGCRYP